MASHQLTPRITGSASSSSPPPAASMKLFIDVDGGAPRVVFAEAGKDAVDFLFSILALPLARADALLGGAVGSVGNLRASVETLDPAFIQPGAARESLLHPTVLSPPAARAELSFHPPLHLPHTHLRDYAVDCGRTFTDGRGAACPSCGDEMTAVARYVPPCPGSSTAGASGFVAATSRYVVTDDLSVFPAPTSAASGVAVFRDLGVRNVGALRQMDVQLGRKEGKEILKASLQSKTVLTDVYLRRRTAPGGERTHPTLEYANATPGRLYSYS
ncbi:LOW QUALITY PROTEIN: hypothetical protein BRADI_1g37140v3 [Brachypodium distachyon]|uniref:Uncharacterized protein n=1 Tax=Brachypodium distachyon TaxID=15368 RepID=A0A2K2DN60_BRADI|nr:LOW QUALITY PROTEIN: hypothetical protein BRADI_1g37140v3 [Brachypodium distachyon]